MAGVGAGGGGEESEEAEVSELAMSSAAFVSGGNPASWQCRHSFIHSTNML